MRGGGLEVSDCGSECCQLVSDCFKLGGDRVGRCVWRAQSAVHDLSPFLQAKLLVCGNHQPECRGGGENDECCGGEAAWEEPRGAACSRFQQPLDGQTSFASAWKNQTSWPLLWRV